MPDYKLSIAIDAQGVSNINNADQFVTIVKVVSTGTPVAWVTFRPMESNTISWTDDYSVYASTTNIEDGVMITTASSQLASPDTMYRLQNGVFSKESTGLGPTTFGVDNQDRT